MVTLEIVTSAYLAFPSLNIHVISPRVAAMFVDQVLVFGFIQLMFWYLSASLLIVEEMV